jgi:hypothetical protein
LRSSRAAAAAVVVARVDGAETLAGENLELLYTGPHTTAFAW